MNLGVITRPSPTAPAEILQRLSRGGAFSTTLMQAIRRSPGRERVTRARDARKRGYGREAVVALAAAHDVRALREIGTTWAREGDAVGFAALAIVGGALSSDDTRALLTRELEEGASIIATLEAAEAVGVTIPPDILLQAAERRLDSGEVADAAYGYAALGQTIPRERLISVAEEMTQYRRYAAARAALQLGAADGALEQLAAVCTSRGAYREAIKSYAALRNHVGVLTVMALARDAGDEAAVAEGEAQFSFASDSVEPLPGT